MVRLHALELLLDRSGDARVRRDWELLREAGLPSQADHRGASNAPHVTLAAAPSFGADDRARAVELLAPLLPAAVRLAGLAVLGARRPALVRLVEVPAPVARAVLALRESLPDLPEHGWLPHVTLARGMRADQVPRALDVVDLEPTRSWLTGLRWWDPESDEVVDL